MPKAVSVHIKPIFGRLSKNEFLECCVDGCTQNAAESFNNILWHFCPKSTFVGAKPLNIAASLGIVTYNDGHESLLQLLPKIGLSYGKHTAKVLKEKDQNRLYLVRRSACERQTKIRQANRKRKLQEEDKSNEKERTVYALVHFRIAKLFVLANCIFSCDLSKKRFYKGVLHLGMHISVSFKLKALKPGNEIHQTLSYAMMKRNHHNVTVIMISMLWKYSKCALI